MKGIAREKKKKRERCLILELICKITGKDKGLVYIACICSLLQFWCRQKYLMGEIGHFSGTHRQKDRKIMFINRQIDKQIERQIMAAIDRQINRQKDI